MKLKKAIDEVIEYDLKELDTWSLNSDERKALIDEIAELSKCRFEMKRNAEVKLLELGKLITSVAAVVVPAAVTVWGTCEVLKFEEEGTITTNAGRGFMNRLIPRG